MKITSLLRVVAFASVFAAGSVFAAEAKPSTEPKVAKCCATAAKDGKTCAHGCCVEAAKAGNNCSHCGGAGALPSEKKK